VVLAHGLLHRQRRAHGAQRVIPLRLWRVEERHRAIADELVQRALLVQDRACRQRQVLVQHLNLELGRGVLAEGGEPPDVGVETGDLLARPSQTDALGVGEQPLDDGRGHVALERPPNALHPGLQLPSLRQVVDDDRDAGRHVATVFERGEIHAQPDRPAGGELWLDLVGHHRALTLFDQPH